jgi:hypothetical protein
MRSEINIESHDAYIDDRVVTMRLVDAVEESQDLLVLRFEWSRVTRRLLFRRVRWANGPKGLPNRFVPSAKSVEALFLEDVGGRNEGDIGEKQKAVGILGQ